MPAAHLSRRAGQVPPRWIGQRCQEHAGIRLYSFSDRQVGLLAEEWGPDALNKLKGLHLKDGILLSLSKAAAEAMKELPRKAEQVIPEGDDPSPVANHEALVQRHNA